MVEFLNRYISIEKESTYGTNPASAPVFGEVDDESFATRMDLLTRQDMSHAVASKSVTGSEYSEGGLNMALQIDDFTGNVLAAFFPKTAFGSSIHTFDEPAVAADAYDSYTIVVGREQKQHIYGGMVASRLSVSANVGEYVMLSADFVGCRESATHAAVSDSAVTFDGAAVDALYFANGSVYFHDGTDSAPAASASVKSISFEVNLNRDTDNAYAIGNSTYTRAPPAQRREVTGTIEFNQVLYGDQTLDEPDYTSLVTEDGLAYNIAGSNPVLKLIFQEETDGANNYLRIDFFNIRFEAPTSNVSGRDTQTMTVNFVGLWDNGADKCMALSMKGGAAASSAY